MTSIDQEPATLSDTGDARKPMLAALLIEQVEVSLDAYIGDARLTVAELNALTPGSAIALDARLDRAVDLKLNGVTVARGELVAVGDHFGVRLTEIAE